MNVIARRVADKLMPWVAANATVWPSTHANQAVLLEQIKELEAEAATNRGAVEALRDVRKIAADTGRDGDQACGEIVARVTLALDAIGGSSVSRR